MVTRFSSAGGVKPRSLSSISGIPNASVASVSLIWPNANQAFYIRVLVLAAFTPSHVFTSNAITVNGNYDIGIYTPDYARIASTGAYAMAGGSTFQFEPFTTPIPAGELILGISSSSATATIYAIDPTARTETSQVRAFEGAQQTSAHVLPSTMVPASPTDFSRVPFFGFVDLLD